MEILKIPIQTITPVWMGGAIPRNNKGDTEDDPTALPELRAPSVRGALRFWLRAFLGGIHGDSDASLVKIRREESLVFGSSEQENSSAANITTRISGLNETAVSGYAAAINPGKFPGLGYQFFSARDTKRELDRKGWEGAFSFILSTRPGIPAANECLRKAYAALWLFSRFGGLGSRARHGGGNFSIPPMPDMPKMAGLPSLTVRAQSWQELAKELEADWATLAAAFNCTRKFTAPTEFDILAPGACDIYVVQEDFPDWRTALNKFGVAFQQFRMKRPPDTGYVIGVLRDGDRRLGGTLQRAAFGLPIPFFFKELAGRKFVSAILTSENEIKKEKHSRRSSPLIVRAIRLSTGKIALVILHFHSRFLPPNEQLVLNNRKGQAPGDTEANRIVNSFLFGSDPKSLQAQNIGLEQVNL